MKIICDFSVFYLDETLPKGTLVLETGQMFQRAGYRVKILNTINFSKSMKYNPFVYIHSEKDVLKLVNTLIANTKGEGEKSAEDFWVKSERLFYTALIGYIWYEAPAEEMNFTTLLEMINASEAREDDPEFQSPVDLMFERLEQKDPDHFAVRQYKKFLLSAGKTRSSILISCGARLAPFDIREVRELMENDEMELDTIGDEKTILFLIMSDTDTTFNFILAMLQSQLIHGTSSWVCSMPPRASNIFVSTVTDNGYLNILIFLFKLLVDDYLHDFLNRIAGIIKRNTLRIVVFPAILAPLLAECIAIPNFLYNLPVLC